MAQPRRRRLATLTILLLAALTLLAIGGPFRSVASRVAHGVVNPFVTAVQSVTRPVGDAIAGTVDYSDVVAQNHVLSAELASLHQQQVQLEYEQRQLRDLLARCTGSRTSGRSRGSSRRRTHRTSRTSPRRSRSTRGPPTACSTGCRSSVRAGSSGR